MDIFLSVLILALIIQGVFSYSAQKASPKPEVSSESVSATQEGSTKVETKINTTVSSDTKTEPSTPSPTPSALSEFQYPGASVTASSENSLSLKSGDDAQKITDWYKELIKAKGMNATSFVSTKANDRVDNKLEGADGQEKISVSIQKDAGASETTININLSY